MTGAEIEAAIAELKEWKRGVNARLKEHDDAIEKNARSIVGWKAVVDAIKWVLSICGAVLLAWYLKKDG